MSKLGLCTFLIVYIIQLVFFYPRNYIFFVRQRISFPDQRKYFDRKKIAFQTTILHLLKDFLSCQFYTENPLIVKGIVWQSIVCFQSVLLIQSGRLRVGNPTFIAFVDLEKVFENVSWSNLKQKLTIGPTSIQRWIPTFNCRNPTVKGQSQW